MLVLNKTMMGGVGNIPESGIRNCLCGAVYSKDHNCKIHVVEPITIGGKDHSARGVMLAQGYVYCDSCGLHAQRAVTTEEAKTNWNRLVG